MDLKTPLYDCHIAAGGKMVSFAGYQLPVQYAGQGLMAEHKAVRGAAGLFDVSHMAEFLITGQDALANIQRIFSNDFANMEIGRVRYTLMLNEQGGVVDDMVIYKMADDRYWVVGNAANHKKDFDWIAARIAGNAKAEDVSADYAQLALQGPKAEEILQGLCKAEHIPTKYYSFVENAVVGGIQCIVSRTGYTGEAGFELYLPPAHAPAMWDMLLTAGKDLGLVPCGLGARDTLRLEAGMPLYGHELSDEIDPYMAGLTFVIKMAKDDFVGKAALMGKEKPQQVRVGLKIIGRGIVREDCPLFANGTKVGVTTSGTHAPYLGYPIAMGYVNAEFAGVGQQLTAEVRGRKVEAEVVALPFYSRTKHK